MADHLTINPAQLVKPRLALGAIVGPIGFIITFVLLGALRPDYSPMKQQISVLATGRDGIWLDIAFVLCGALMIVGVQGIRISLLRNASAARQVAVAVLLCLPAVGMVLCGLFPIDSGGPGHFIAANIVFLGPIVGFLGSGVLLFPVPRLRPIAIALLVASVLTAAGLCGYFAGAPTVRDFRTIAGGGTIGLWERILGIEIVGWYVVLGAEALRQRVTW
ncbi:MULTISPECIES: DUF998 domain-containing protein [unclassified Nocardia]|uniref:DUF998 domain-containing protein n=1 Tax=unclassified Nocardia TaxID=2637762 RepID=UPI001CE40015|nr:MULTISPECIES: DUF998 domain-containing protein [unclassified Nocardia]